ncbi:MAG: protein kinase [Chitinivibrionales bacterium]|nr:protein kinase [Chitinivibrionales bacterium]MBD3357485.1 protein kinase [Chitinivibrionales bacterium]
MELQEKEIRSFIGRDLGTVTIVRELGRGAGGVVFVGFQRTLQRQVAVKVLPKSSIAGPEARRRFKFEAQLVAGLFHPNIVPVFEMGEAKDCWYQVMQIVQGEDLEKYLRKCRKNPIATRRILPLAKTCRIMLEVLDGLQYAHDQQVVHQDIKPGNILIQRGTARAMITDFGIAKACFFDGAQRRGFIVGSPLYMAPEQASGVGTDHRADIYSLGMVLYQMTAPALPLAEKDALRVVALKIDQPECLFTKWPSEVSPIIGPQLECVILKALAPDPRQRYQNCRAFRADLEMVPTEKSGSKTA